MEKILTKTVIGQRVDGLSMENYLARLLEEIDNGNIDKERMGMTIAVSKQLNNRHKNIIDALRVEIKALETLGDNKGGVAK